MGAVGALDRRRSVTADTSCCCSCRFAARGMRYRLSMASADRVTVSLDASIVAQTREQLGEPLAELGDAAIVERALDAYLLRRMFDATQAASGLSDEEAERVAYEELAASRRERRLGA